MKVHDTLAVSYPKILGGVDKGTFAEMVAQTLGRGKMSSEALRGLLVERICRALPETRDLLHAMDKVMLAANKGTAKGKGWKNLRFAYSMVDGHGKQLGDLTIVCEHPDGRVWIMAIIESKSVSNTGDLAKLGDLPVGQHLWDFTRAKGSGVVIDGRMFKPSKVETRPVPTGSWGEKAGAVATKSTDQRVKEMAAGRFTQFIGFVPREMMPYEALRVAADGFQLELWKWPFDISDFDNFQKELVKVLGRKRTLP